VEPSDVVQSISWSAEVSAGDWIADALHAFPHGVG